jgi:RND superfamily putative drug exporter
MVMARVMSALRHAAIGRRTNWIILGLWLALAVVLGPFAGRLLSIENDRIDNYLPQAAQSTRVEKLLKRFPEGQTTAAVIVYARSGGLSRTDRDRIRAIRESAVQKVATARSVGPVVPAADGAAALFIVALRNDVRTVPGAVATIRDLVRNQPEGVKVGVTGPAAFLADDKQALRGIDSELLLAAGTAVAVLLLLIYRSPLLCLIPFVTTILALIAARAAVYGMARYIDLTVTGVSAGVLNVLVFGAGTDYALLLIARYREELKHRQDSHKAMARALRRAAPAIIASAATVILGLLCLLAASLNSDRGLGPVAAAGIFCALVAALTVLPALFLVCGRWAFWPSLPYPAMASEAAGFWAGVGKRLARRPRLVWVTTVVVLGAGAGGLAGLHLGLPQSKGFMSSFGAVQGQALLDAHFPAGVEAPTLIIARSASAARVVDTVNQIPGVTKVGQLGQADGLTQLAVVLQAAPDSAGAYAIVRRLRDRLAALPDAHALVGGSTAMDLDIEQGAARDREVVMPLVLAAVMVVLGLLFRALVAPLVLMATVILSFAAALGVSSLAFDWGFRFAGVAQSVPLDVFIFLVALGIDYNVFLMSRVRQEVARAGTRTGLQRALAVTGGVVTSAGVVLATTFAVLALFPLVVLVEIGFAVAFGILLDTFVVRSILVPALVLELGQRIWWPSGLK